MDDDHRQARALARRDRAAWAAAFDRHSGDVFGLAYHLTGGRRAAAEEIHQEVWLVAIERIAGFDPRRGRFRNWLLGIARHRVARHFRREAGEGRDDADRLDGPTDALTPPDLAEGAERAEMVRAALLCLDADRRGVLQLKYVDGLSVREIAGQTGRSAKAVESLLSRARGQLRGLLQPYFAPLADRRPTP